MLWGEVSKQGGSGREGGSQRPADSGGRSTHRTRNDSATIAGIPFRALSGTMLQDVEEKGGQGKLFAPSETTTGESGSVGSEGKEGGGVGALIPTKRGKNQAPRRKQQRGRRETLRRRSRVPPSGMGERGGRGRKAFREG